LQRAVIIVAGGIGSRMRADIPKQFILLNGRPLIYYTIAAFLEIEEFSFNEIVVVCNKSYINKLNEILSTYFKDINFKVVEGGESRFHSCYNGIKAISLEDKKLIAIHDAARPLVSKQLIKTVFEKAVIYQSAIPVVRLKDSVRMIFDDQNNSKIIDRDSLRLVQTPQCFIHYKLLQAYENALKTDTSNFTDDASVWEAEFGKVSLCEGDAKNIKVTEPFDLKIAKTLLHIY